MMAILHQSSTYAYTVVKIQNGITYFVDGCQLVGKDSSGVLRVRHLIWNETPSSRLYTNSKDRANMLLQGIKKQYDTEEEAVFKIALVTQLTQIKTEEETDG